MQEQKPELTLTKGSDITPEKVANLFRKLTGREPTEAEMAEVREKLSKKG